MRKKISLLVISLLLFTALAAGAHHHADNRPHDDCPVCVAAEHSPAVSGGADVISVSGAITPIESLQKIFHLPVLESVLSCIRAPPLF